MATPSMIGSPCALILYSGSQQAYKADEPDLLVLAKCIFLSEDAGAASLHDLALLSGMYGLFSGFLHATALVRSSTSAVKFTDLLVPWLGAMTEYTKAMAKQIDEGKYASEGSNIAMQLVAIQNIIDASAAQQVSADFIRPMKQLMEKAVTAGHSDEMCGTANGKLMCGEQQDSQGSETSSLATPTASSGVESTPASTFTTSPAPKSTSPVNLNDQTTSVVQTPISSPSIDDSQASQSTTISTEPSATASADTTNTCGSVQKRTLQQMRIMGR
ncbi:hypothetical protein PENSUB_9543 [Penicillium subrubescens]|uniref:NADPH-dependent reductive aminase-like C-terminal domain-containing protein n=1 Tax=Penicillium subrubescens TaxID=1316194 RepID=A0A1Q5TD16_9EURO|nr:hypothetical protein PENSUB_9543 [Penicillium subrubescens]